MKWMVAGSAAVVAALALLLVQGAPRVEAATTLYVTSSADSGPGSLRDAVTTANGNASVNLIVLKNATPITLTSYVEYSGAQSLTVRSDSLLTNRVMQGASACSLFISTGGADITFQRVTFQDSACSGIEVPVDNGDGEVVVTLDRVVIQRVLYYGLIASEGGPRDASIRVKLTSSVIQDTGGTGIYAYEDGPGALTMDFAWSSVVRVGGDGVFAVSYEGGALNLRANNSSFSGHRNSGLSLWTKSGANAEVTLQNVQVNGNGAHGLFVEDFDGGGIGFWASGSTFSDNNDVGVMLGEHDEGGVQLTLLLSRLERNGGPGLVASEDDAGSVEFLVSGTAVWRNDCCSPAVGGIQVLEEEEGDLRGMFSSTTAYDNNGGGFVLSERADGVFDVTMYLSGALGNNGPGTFASAGGDPGVLRVLGSAVGPYDLTNVTVVP